MFSYNNWRFLLPGDEVISNNETINFHKGEKYKIKQVFHHKGKLLYVVENKWGDGITIQYNEEFEIPNRARVDSLDRKLRSRFGFCWTHSHPFLSSSESNDYDWEYKVSVANGYGGKGAFTHATVYKGKTEYSGFKRFTPLAPIDIPSVFENKDEFVNFWVKTTLESDKDDTHYSHSSEYVIIRGSWDRQNNIDILAFISEYSIPPSEELHMTLYPTSKYWRGAENIDEFFKYLAMESFDVLEWGLTTANDKDITRDIMILFRDLPKSHSSTSVSKILTGSSKVKISSLEQYSGKYKGVYKRQLVYEMANTISNHLYHYKIFGTKEEYSSGEEWRGQFEFIGSKTVNIVELEKYLTY